MDFIIFLFFEYSTGNYSRVLFYRNPIWNSFWLLPVISIRTLPTFHPGILSKTIHGFYRTVLLKILREKKSRILLRFFLRTASGILPRILPEFFENSSLTYFLISCRTSSHKNSMGFFPGFLQEFFQKCFPELCPQI